MKLEKYILNCNEIYHTTIDPKGPGIIRIHLIPPKDLKLGVPWVAIINGYYVLPMQTSWAVLLKIYIENFNKTNADFMDDEVIGDTVIDALEIFDKTDPSLIKNDIKDILRVFRDIARGIKPDEKIGYMSLSKYGKHMSAPHRLDLMISAMTRNGKWACNQKCLHCYAADESLSSRDELTKEDWFKIIDKAKEARVPQLTFTGGEPTTRKDLVDLIEHSKFFVTRLNTNGVLLTKKLCKELYDASLDSVQITFYSSNPKIHNLLVGANNFEKTVEGINNALDAGLDVSVNTPLCSLNKDYLETVKFLKELGVTYFSSSGLIPSGNALKTDSEITRLTNQEITNIIKKTYSYAKDNGCELSFTSPGWIEDIVLEKMNMVVPSCGACLSNMAIAPDGTVMPCQSWLNGLELGNLLTDDWKDIWNNSNTKKIRKAAMKNQKKCLLNEVNK